MSRRTRIKICGITRVEDALAAAALGADAIGLVFAARSPRRVTLDAARAIVDALPPFVASVALFMDDEPDVVRATVTALSPDLVQFHGAEDAAYCEAFGRRYLRAVPMAGRGREAIVAAARAHPRAVGLVLDGHGLGEAGGSGRSFDWSQARAEGLPPLVVAGGLDPDNVGQAIRVAAPWAVDVSSGVESAPGIKDHGRMARFIEEVHRVRR
jgi:phosphoribosylanthranilate isomerase